MTRAEGKWSGFTANANLVVFFMLAFFFISSIPAHAAFGVLSKDDKACLNCHAKKPYDKTNARGDSVSLHINDKKFSESVHNDNGCTDCHTNLEKVDIKKHEKSDNKSIGTRAYSVAAIKVCVECHKKTVKQYDDSLHASLVRGGHEEAPICTDCHDPHSVRAESAIAPVDDVPCGNCHAKIVKAYAGSIHGHARTKQVEAGKIPKDDTKAPICSDCHKSHGILAAVAQGRIANSCLSCHKSALAAHKKWLPNTELHYEAISCSTCHVTTTKRRVDLRLYDTIAKKDISEKTGVPMFESRAKAADSQGLGLDALALQSLLTEFNRDIPRGGTVLRGRLELSSGIEMHQLTDKSKAIKDCDTCHSSGTDVFQTVTVSISRPDGRSIRHGAQSEVLTSPISVDSVKGFYAIGGTRIKLLDVLFAIALFVGITVPVVHMSSNWLFRRYLRNIEAKKRAPPPQT